MPPQVNPCGPGTRSIANQTCNEVEEAKSKEPEKRSAESEKDLSTRTDAPAHRATPKEVANRIAELSTQAAGQQAALNRKLDDGRGKPPSAEASAEVMRDFREINTDDGRGKPPSAEASAEAMSYFREVNTDDGRGKPPSAEASAEAMSYFREVNTDDGRGKPPSAKGSAEVMRDFREINSDDGRGKPSGAKVRKR